MKNAKALITQLCAVKNARARAQSKFVKRSKESKRAESDDLDNDRLYEITTKDDQENRSQLKKSVTYLSLNLNTSTINGFLPTLNKVNKVLSSDEDF